MAIFSTSWLSGVSGNWDTSSDWSKGEPASNYNTTISAPGIYTVSLTSAGSAYSLTIDAAQAEFSESSAGSLTIGTTLSVEAGEAVLDAANTITGGVTQSGGVIETDNASALGAAAYNFEGGAFLATANLTLGNTIAFSGQTEFAAGTGDVLTLGGASWSMNAAANTAVSFGNGGPYSGTVIWDIPTDSSITGAHDYSVFVNFGTLKAGDSGLSNFLSNAGITSVTAGADLDAAGYNLTIDYLQGYGTIEDSGEAATLTITNGGNFSGIIENANSLVVEGGVLILQGANTYSGTTEIDSGATLELGNSTTASVAHDIVDNGQIDFGRTNTDTLGIGISGTGVLTQSGPGTLVINHNETYSGGTNILAGELSINRASAVGTGTVTLNGGELLTTATFSLTNALALNNDITFAASTGSTLTLNKSSGSLNVNTIVTATTITFGDSNDAGTVVWHTPASSDIAGTNSSVTVADGTLELGDANFSLLIKHGDVTVDSAGTLDLGGFGTTLDNLTGSGVVTNSGASTTLDVDGGDFTGQIDGAIKLHVTGAVTFTGGGTYSGPVTLESGSTFDFADTTTRTIDFAGAGTLNVTNASGVAETLNLGLAGSGSVVTGGAGNDIFQVGATLTSADEINGGTGTSEVDLNGNYAGANALTMSATTITNMSEIHLSPGFSYNLTLNAATVVSGQTLEVNAVHLTAGETLTLDGSAIGGALVVYCGAGTNVVTGGNSGDTFYAETGTDTFNYTSAAQSTSIGYDTFEAFNYGQDVFNIPGGAGTITTIDAALTSGSLSTATFDSDLTAALNGHLTAHGAILFTPSSGTLHGQTFLIVDENGTAGYQAGADLVFDMKGAIGTLATSDFI